MLSKTFKCFFTKYVNTTAGKIEVTKRSDIRSSHLLQMALNSTIAKSNKFERTGCPLH